MTCKFSGCGGGYYYYFCLFRIFLYTVNASKNINSSSMVYCPNVLLPLYRVLNNFLTNLFFLHCHLRTQKGGNRHSLLCQCYSYCTNITLISDTPLRCTFATFSTRQVSFIFLCVTACTSHNTNTPER